MARYFSSYFVRLNLEQIQPLLTEILKSCNFEKVYNNDEYLMAKENPGDVAFGKLVTVEAFLNTTNASSEGVQVDIFVKNDELPLQNNNHCQQKYKVILEAIAQENEWQLIENVAG